jgi:hypothetical protein
MTAKAEVYCCKGCGRDTTRRGGYCIDCGGAPGERSSKGESRGRHNRAMQDDNPMDLEDRFDDESGPDDVCDDGGVPNYRDKTWLSKLASEERRRKKRCN